MFQLIFGKFYGYFPIKWVFLTAIIIFEIGSAVCGAAPTSDAFIVGRSIAGLGASGIFQGAMVIVAYSVEPRKRPMCACCRANYMISCLYFANSVLQTMEFLAQYMASRPSSGLYSGAPSRPTLSGDGGEYSPQAA